MIAEKLANLIAVTAENIDLRIKKFSA